MEIYRNIAGNLLVIAFFAMVIISCRVHIDTNKGTVGSEVEA